MKNVIATASVCAAPLASIALALALGAGCGGTEETSPFAKTDPPPASTGGPGTPGTTNPPPGTIPGNDDAGTTADAGPTTNPNPTGTGIGCGHSPARYVVLGHSVAHCFAVGGVDSETCSLRNTYTKMAAQFPGLKYENYAVDGAVIADVLKSQLPKIPSGPGHMFVNLFIGGNDLAAHLYESDAQAKKSWDTIKPQAQADLESILSTFDDATRFPDKATILVNSQYNPFDECVAGTYSFVTTVKQGYIIEYNNVLASLVAAHKNSVLTDQYTTFLGHGHNYNQSKCPHYAAGDEYWMADLIHPNEKGHVNLSKEMQATVERIYKCQ